MGLATCAEPPQAACNAVPTDTANPVNTGLKGSRQAFKDFFDGHPETSQRTAHQLAHCNGCIDQHFAAGNLHLHPLTPIVALGFLSH